LSNLSYVTVPEFKAYLAGTGHSAVWSEDDSLLLRLLESASDDSSQYVLRDWRPRTQMKVFDLGRGRGRYDARMQPEWLHFYAPTGYLSGDDWEWWPFPDYWAGILGQGTDEVNFADWLLTPTSVVVYADTARSSSQSLVLGTDYFLRPYNELPASLLVMNENTTKRWSYGQRVLEITGEWGWPYDLDQIGTLTGTLDATTRTFAVSGEPLVAGMTLRIGSETMYVLKADGTVRRGQAGTTAATHTAGTAVLQITYPSDLVQVVIALARNRFREKNAAPLIGDVTPTTMPQFGSEKSIFCGLDSYRMKRRKMRSF
jgi:hypothetical protein